MNSNECSAMFILDGRAVRLSFRPDDGTLRFLDASGVCLREGHCNLSWRDLLSNIRQFNQRKKGSQIHLVDLLMLANRET